MKIFTYIQFAISLALFTHEGSVAQKIVGDTNYATRLWYRQPATNWNEALPVGNGRMGAMIFGGIKDERLQLNEQTLWSGAPRNWNNPGAKKYLPLIRDAVVQKNYKQADSLSKFMQGPYTESYLPMGDVLIHYNNINDSSSYSRELNIDNALSKVQFSNNGNVYTRTTFASFPDQVIVYHDTCTTKGMLSFTASLSSKLHFSVQKLSSGHIVLKGKCPMHVEPSYLWRIKDDKAIQYAPDDKGEGMNFELHLLIKTTGGTISSNENSVTVSGADAVTFIIAAATSYNGYYKSPGLAGKNPSVNANHDLTAAGMQSFEQLKERHIRDYQPFFRRVQLNLGESNNKNLPTDERLKKMDSYTDPELIATIAQYGRYLLIAGSRPGGQPVNLKGIWNDKVRPEYSSNYCIDHDAQMFYYPVETNNLAEMHEPFLQFIEDLSKNGRQTAMINYGMRGWCAHHNTDIWRQSAPVGNYGEGNPHWANWNMAGPWLCAHLFDHYLFSGDKKFLQQKAWPVMKGAALFCLNWLVKDKNGRLNTLPSVSPENTFITGDGDTAMVSSNATADIALIKELFTHCIQATEILQIEKPFGRQLKKALALLPAYKTGSRGQLLEWQEEWRPLDPSHRHLSHMYPIFPGSEISVLHTAALANAAKKALTLREKTNSSWGFAWKAACWARLGEGDSAWQTLQYQLRYAGAQNKSAGKYGLFPNLFNSEGQATIMNGNGCATAVITEMLLQSHTGEIQFLPALPSIFTTGTMDGICARGGFVIDLSWNNHAFKNAVVCSRLGNDCKIKVDGPVKIYDGGREIAATKIASNVLLFKTAKGRRYTIQALQTGLQHQAIADF
ncbi:MAG: glycoside hydrolase family 95 protein [Bacteroidota bacterium]